MDHRPSQTHHTRAPLHASAGLDLVNAHPLEQLEGLAFGWLEEPDAAAVRAHVAACSSCRDLLADAHLIRARLALLRAREPTIDVREHVRRRLDEDIDPN
jgi:hypothetical protein